MIINYNAFGNSDLWIDIHKWVWAAKKGGCSNVYGYYNNDFYVFFHVLLTSNNVSRRGGKLWNSWTVKHKSFFTILSRDKIQSKDFFVTWKYFASIIKWYTFSV